MNTHDLYNEAIGKWGRDAVTAKAIEECGELVSVLAKYSLNEEHYGFDTSKVIDEIADVTIMMEQLALIYGYSDVHRRIDFKRDRLKSLLEQ